MDTAKLRIAKNATRELVKVLSTWFVDKPDYTDYLGILKDIKTATNIDQLNNSLADAWNLFDNETTIEVKK